MHVNAIANAKFNTGARRGGDFCAGHVTSKNQYPIVMPVSVLLHFSMARY